MKMIYTHDCKTSPNSHLRKYKHWTKVLSDVDTSKTNGYAFVGEFLPVQCEHKLAVGSLVVEACGDDVTLYRVTEEGKEKIAEAKRLSMSGLIKKAAEELEKGKAPEARLQELKARRSQLQKELEAVESPTA